MWFRCARYDSGFEICFVRGVLYLFTYNRAPIGDFFVYCPTLVCFFRIVIMLLILSPAKSLDFESAHGIKKPTQAQFIAQSAQLMTILRQYDVPQLSELMHVSDKLAALNVTRNHAWQPTFEPHVAKPAMAAFNGDVYVGLDAASLSARDWTYAQKTVRILSGLYGVLRPMDLIHAYRLEMGTQLANAKGKDLYAFWGDTLAQHLNTELAQHASKYVLNLASDEYFKALPLKALDYPVIQPVFLERKNDVYKIISFFAKRARGTMARYVVQHKIQKPELLQNFAEDGYRFVNSQMARNGVQELIFRRG